MGARLGAGALLQRPLPETEKGAARNPATRARGWNPGFRSAQNRDVAVLLDRRSLLLSGLAGAVRLRAAARPNILLIVSDDQRFDTINALGNSAVHTPALDRLVKQGVTFTNAYVSNPICTPSRACLLTGRDDWDTGVRWFGESIRPELPVMPEVFASLGYETFFTGKWHNDSTPGKRGFTKTRFVFPKGMGEHEMSFEEPGGTAKGFSSELFATAAVDYLRSGPKQPFFAMVSFTAPHDPRTPPPDWAARYKPESLPLPKNFMPEHPFDNGELKIRDEMLLPWPRTEQAVRGELATYYGMISHMDEQIGRILGTLEQTGMLEDTLVAFVSDNGLAVGSHGLLGKMSMYDHSVKVPMILRLPGHRLAGRRVDGLCYHHQLFATFCAEARVKAPAGLERPSLVEMAERRSQGFGSVSCSYRDVQRMVRTGDWKLIWYPKAGRWQLFNLKADPDELNDLSTNARHGATLKELAAQLAAHMKRRNDPLAGHLKV
jgi:arylsulfatase A-like enzyme